MATEEERRLMNMGFSPRQAAFLALVDAEEATTSTLGLVKKAANVNMTSTAATPPFADLTAAATAYNALRTDVVNILAALKGTDSIMGA